MPYTQGCLALTELYSFLYVRLLGLGYLFLESWRDYRGGVGFVGLFHVLESLCVGFDLSAPSTWSALASC